MNRVLPIVLFLCAFHAVARQPPVKCLEDSPERHGEDRANAQAANLEVLSAVGMRQVMIELGPAFERKTGHKLKITFDASGTIAKRIEAGERADVVMISREALDRLAGGARVVPGSEVDLASSVAGLAVRRGAPRPDISTPAAFKSALLRAKTIARPDPALGGASGLHIAKVLERLGIAEQVMAKSVIVSTPGEERTMPGYLVADGRAEIALHQVQELLAIPGIEVVGPFPAELEETFVFSAGIVASSKRAAAARELIEFLRTPEAMAVIEATGMRVASPADDHAGERERPMVMRERTHAREVEER